MLNTAQAYDDFYATTRGALAQAIISKHIKNLWPDLSKKRILSCGYTAPYLKGITDKCDRHISLIPPIIKGAQPSPNNNIFISQTEAIPLADDMMDNICLIHAMEFFTYQDNSVHNHSLDELWRVLNPNGRMIIVLPNRMGFWSKLDSTPFGQGQPYSFTQITQCLKAYDFNIETCHPVLFTPPFKQKTILQTFKGLEKIGKYLPLFPGAYIIEVSKQIPALSGRIRHREPSSLLPSGIGFKKPTLSPN